MNLLKTMSFFQEFINHKSTYVLQRPSIQIDFAKDPILLALVLSSSVQFTNHDIKINPHVTFDIKKLEEITAFHHENSKEILSTVFIMGKEFELAFDLFHGYAPDLQRKCIHAEHEMITFDANIEVSADVEHLQVLSELDVSILTMSNHQFTYINQGRYKSLARDVLPYRTLYLLLNQIKQISNEEYLFYKAYARLSKEIQSVMLSHPNSVLVKSLIFELVNGEDAEQVKLAIDKLSKVNNFTEYLNQSYLNLLSKGDE
jgi:hypothetical protein